jgi:hypothetical protein
MILIKILGLTLAILERGSTTGTCTSIGRAMATTALKKRKPHLDKLFRHFDILVDRAKEIKTDFQLYSILLDFDSSSDALFLHTPNPNNSQFPFKVADLKLTTTLKNEQLNEYINNLKEYEKLYGQAGEGFCLLFKKSVGHPF